MSRVALLPEELSRSDEWRGVLELPPHHIGPLVRQQGQVTMRTNPFRERRIHDCLTGGADSDGFWHFRLSTLGDPGDLRCETRDVILFFIESRLCDEHGEVDVLNAVGLELGVAILLDLLPDVVGRGSQDVAT